MWYNEYDNNLKKHFIENEDIRLAIAIGLPQEGYEMRLLSRTHRTFDLFLVYKYNETHQWNGYHFKRYVYRYIKYFFKPFFMIN